MPCDEGTSGTLKLLPSLPPVHPGKRKVFWQNLREEPLVFINGQPFVVRESDQPFSNLEYTGERGALEEGQPLWGQPISVGHDFPRAALL